LSGLDWAPDWAINYAKDARNFYEFERPRPMRKQQIKAWIETLREAEKIFLKVESFLRYRKGARINPDTGCRFGAGYTVKLLQEAIEFLDELLRSGPVPNLAIPRHVSGLVALYEKDVGRIITEAFKDVLPKKIINGDTAEWARTKTKRYRKLIAYALGDPTATRDRYQELFNRSRRGWIHNPYVNPPRKGISLILDNHQAQKTINL
jgi:hypothetical protein